MSATGSSSRIAGAGVAVALALACGCATTAAETAAAGRWYEVRTPRFQLWTDGDPNEARNLVLDLEHFHQVMLAKTTAEERSAAPPLRIFLAKDRASFVAWTGAPSLSGGFRATYRGNYALLTSSGSGAQSEEGEAMRPTSRHILFHEYTHYMMAAQGARVPSWYNEGFAEYMATTEFREDGSYTLGCPPRYRTQWLKYLQWLPIGRVMEAEDVAELVSGGGGLVRTRREPTDAYAQSWYAVHYFSADDARQKQLREYLKLWASETSAKQAAESAFGMGYPQLDRVLQQYAQQAKLPCVAIHPARAFAQPVIDVRPLSSAETHYHVGDLLLSMFGPTDAALHVLQEAARLEPGDARTLAAMARAYWLRAERAPADQAAPMLRDAERYLSRARQAASADPEILAIEGHIRRMSANDLKARDGDAAEQIKLARSAYRKAIRADETLAEAYYGLGLTYLIEDSGSKEPEVVLEAAAYLLPLDPHIALAFAQLQIQRGNALTAVPALEYVLRWSKSEEVRAQVKEKITELRAAVDTAPAAVRPASAPAGGEGRAR
jgi:tetratricopeptide (TPR) repeat protein